MRTVALLATLFATSNLVTQSSADDFIAKAEANVSAANIREQEKFISDDLFGLQRPPLPRLL